MRRRVSTFGASSVEQRRVAGLTPRDGEGDRPCKPIGSGVKLRCQAVARALDCFRRGLPYPPAAERWTWVAVDHPQIGANRFCQRLKHLPSKAMTAHRLKRSRSLSKARESQGNLPSVS